MTKILCPTRGGEQSYPNQDRAIALAAELEAELIFLYVADDSMLNKISSPILIDMEAELEELGEFVLAMAQERAEEKNIAAGAIVSSGLFQQALEDTILAEEITTVVLGMPSGDSSSIPQDHIEQINQRLVEKYKVEVYLIDQGEIASHIKA
jgi:nucleotide-binding universal stress UspA family protein